MNKNVLWINHFVPYPAKGGLLIRTHGLLQDVVKDHNVTLVCLIQPRLISPYFKSIDSGLEEARKFYESQGVQVHFLEMPSEKSKFSRYLVALKSLFSSKPYSVNWLQSSSFTQRLNQLLSKNVYDYIHVDTMGLLDAVDLRPHADKVVINHHNAEHAMMSRRASKEPNFLKRIYYKLEAKKIAEYDAQKMAFLKSHIVCSDEDGAELRSLVDNLTVNTVPNGIQITVDPVRTPITGNLLFVGGLDWYPNTDAILYLCNEICPALEDENVNVRIDIVGKNPSEEIKSAVSKFSFVKLHGYVDDINKFYSEAQAFLCPLRDGGGTKLKVLDAMNYGLPVIGSDIAFEGIRVVNQENGIVANTPQEILTAIKSILNNRESTETIGQKGRELVEANYSAKDISAKYSASIASS